LAEIVYFKGLVLLIFSFKEPVVQFLRNVSVSVSVSGGIWVVFILLVAFSWMQDQINIILVSLLIHVHVIRFASCGYTLIPLG
jgi:hypothetical protein